MDVGPTVADGVLSFVPFSSRVSAVSVAHPPLAGQCQLGGRFWRAQTGVQPTWAREHPFPRREGAADTITVVSRIDLIDLASFAFGF